MIQMLHWPLLTQLLFSVSLSLSFLCSQKKVCLIHKGLIAITAAAPSWVRPGLALGTPFPFSHSPRKKESHSNTPLPSGFTLLFFPPVFSVFLLFVAFPFPNIHLHSSPLTYLQEFKGNWIRHLLDLCTGGMSVNRQNKSIYFCVAA